MGTQELRLQADDYKVVIISDTHLTAWPDKYKLEVLLSIIKGADRVVLNGDFWDSFQTDYESFAASSWQRLFPLLLERKAVYVFGNHDPQITGDYSAFCVAQASRVVITQKGVRFRIEHGNGILPFVDERHYVPKFVLKYGTALRGIAIRYIGVPLLAIHRKDNGKIKEWKKAHMPSYEWLICGHTHWPEIDPESRFVNSGLVAHGHYTYVEINDGQVALKGNAIIKKT